MARENERRRAVIVIPAYNEAGTIGRLIDIFLQEIFPKMSDWDMHILIVDGNSTDATKTIVAGKIGESGGKLHILNERAKSGLGAAYMKGFINAKYELSADVVIEFDADFQHPPEMVPLLLDKINEGYDCVLGSRKIVGGSESADRARIRKFLTGFGGFLARLILFFPGRNFGLVTDPTSGLRATRVRNILDRIDLSPDHLISKKFGYKVQFLSEILAVGARYIEIPLKFGERVAGHSKFSPDTTFDILMSCFKTRLHQPPTIRFMRFAVVGFLGYVINAIFLAWLPKIIGIEPLIWLLSTEAAIISNFIFNNIWTFRDNQIRHFYTIVAKFIQFNITSAVALLIQTVMGTIGVAVFGAGYRQIILIVVIVIAVVPCNWFLYNKIIWKNQ